MTMTALFDTDIHKSVRYDGDQLMGKAERKRKN